MFYNIDNICKKHGIKYYFSEGTALGLYRLRWKKNNIINL